MPNQKVTVGGKPFDVKFTFSSFLAMEERYKVNVMDMGQTSPRFVAVLVWGAISHAAPTATPESIAQEMTVKEGYLNLRECIKAINDDVPEPEAKADGKGT